MGILKVENNQVIFSEGNQFGSIICYRETEMLILTMHLKKYLKVLNMSNTSGRYLNTNTFNS